MKRDREQLELEIEHKRNMYKFHKKQSRQCWDELIELLKELGALDKNVVQ